MFDDDKSGRLEMNELSSIVHEVYGHSKRDKKYSVCVCGGCSAGANILYALTLGAPCVCSHSVALRKLTKYAHVNNKVKTVSEHDFLLLVKSAPALLFPVFRLQQQVGMHTNSHALVSHRKNQLTVPTYTASITCGGEGVLEKGSSPTRTAWYLHCTVASQD